jgi:hypothetical protein
MRREQTGFVVVGAGVIAVLLAILADPIGIGGADGFGWKQIVLLVVGVILAILGAVAVSRTTPSGGPGEL